MGQTSVPLRHRHPPPRPPPGWGRDLRDSFMSSGRTGRTSTPNPNTDCLHPAAQKPSPAAGGPWAAHHTPSNCSYCLSSAQQSTLANRTPQLGKERIPDLVYRQNCSSKKTLYTHTLGMTGNGSAKKDPTVHLYQGRNIVFVYERLII